MLTLPTRSSGERRTHSSEWERTQMLRRERHAHRWPSKVRGAVLARSARSSGERRTHSSKCEGTQMLRRERHAHRWPSKVRGAMLALLTMLERERHAHRWPSKVRRAMLVLPIMRATYGIEEAWQPEAAEWQLWRAKDSTLSMRGKSDAQKGAACS